MFRWQPDRPARVTTPPAADFLEDATVYGHLRVPLSGSPESPTDSATIQVYRDAVQSELDGPTGWLGRCLITQTLEMQLDAFPRWCGADRRGRRYPGADAPILLPCPPVQSVTSIAYLDGNGDTQTLAASAYTLVNNGANKSEIAPAYGTVWPETRDIEAAVTVTWVAGYGATAADVPPDIVAAGLLLLQDLYENRTAQELGTALQHNETVTRLLTKFRVQGFG
jgi:uncharacterized phiE125 gp8 family phage protein